MLGKKIYKLRKKINVSQEELAMAINTSRQAVSKWELGESLPEVNKLKDIASFFGVSIDYLLDYDVKNTSCNDFLSRLDNAINNKDFSITVDEIKSYVLRFNNNFLLYCYSFTYLFVLELEKNERNLLDLIIAYCKKAISLYDFQETKDITLRDIHLFVIQTYTTYKKYDLAVDYMQKNNVYDKKAAAECNYRFKKYEESLNIISNIYMSAISDILVSTQLEVRILLKQKMEKEAYELTNWILNLINSIEKQEGGFLEDKILYLYLKAVCEKVLKIKADNTIQDLIALVNNVENFKSDSSYIKFYHGEKVPFYTDFKDCKKKLKEEIIEDKAEHYELYCEVYKEIFGGGIDE